MAPELLLMEEHACERLWRRHADRLLLYASSLLSDRAAAEDALQNVFVRLLGTEEPPVLESERAFLFRAVRNEALNAMRARRIAARHQPPMFEAAAEDPHRTAELADTGRKVESVLRRLPAEEREAVVLKVWSELSFPDAAAVAGVSEKTFEHRYYRGLAALKQKLGDSDDRF